MSSRLLLFIAGFLMFVCAWLASSGLAFEAVMSGLCAVLCARLSGEIDDE